MPVILTVDGPSLGGFVCAATIVSSELWKVGQVRPHDSICFRRITIEEAYVAALRTDALMAAVKSMARGEVDAKAAAAKLDAFEVDVPAMPETKPVLVEVPARTDSPEGDHPPGGDHPGYLIRLAGDRYVQIEYGPMDLDLTLRWAWVWVWVWVGQTEAAKGADRLVHVLYYRCSAHTTCQLLLTPKRTATRITTHHQGAYSCPGEGVGCYGPCRSD